VVKCDYVNQAVCIQYEGESYGKDTDGEWEPALAAVSRHSPYTANCSTCGADRAHLAICPAGDAILLRTLPYGQCLGEADQA
jgi:hypothetical protein